MMDNQLFMAEPEEIFVVHSAAHEWKRFVGGRTEDAARAELTAFHLKHVQKMIDAGNADAQQGGVWITDIPGFDLSVVDAHFPALHERRVEVFTRRGVAMMLSILKRENHPTIAIH